MLLAGIVAAVSGVLLGWQVPASSPQLLKAILVPAPVQTSAPSKTTTPLRAPIADAKAAPVPAGMPAEKSEPGPEVRTQPSATADRWIFRLTTPSARIDLDPARGKASLETPLGSVRLDADKREARMEAASLYLGLAW
jgi:hypothetical protein